MLTPESLQRRAVLTSDGVVIGSIHKLIIRPEDWRIIAFEVKLRKDVAERAGIQLRTFRTPTIQLSTAIVQSTADAVILSVPLAALRTPQQPQAPAQPRPQAAPVATPVAKPEPTPAR
ncbi:MAG: hypothetical protein KF773_37630 [Deltaproteobacteria bacterium]|nr:hypothetical protein [Deltaproteobacteria bacterium]MCW5805804.1 hypothetical protein [Deltaproteobacteria bacterium]